MVSLMLVRIGLYAPSSSSVPYPPRSSGVSSTPIIAGLLTCDILVIEEGVNHGFGGTETYAIFIRLGVAEVLGVDVDMEDEKEVLGVVGTGVLGTVGVIGGLGLVSGPEWKDFMDWTRLTDGDSSCTYTLRLRGVVECRKDGIVDWRARGSGLSWGIGGLAFGGGVAGRRGAGGDGFMSRAFCSKN